MYHPSANFTRPADTTPYAIGDLVANNTTAGSVVPLTLIPTSFQSKNWELIVRRIKISKTGTSPTNASFRVHLFAGTSAPGVANGDNGAFQPTALAGYLGSLDVTIGFATSDGAVGIGAATAGNEIRKQLGAGVGVYALVEARGTYTPVSGETFTVELDMDKG